MPSCKSLKFSRCFDRETVLDDAPVTLQRIVRRRLFRPLMTAELGPRKLRMDAGEQECLTASEVTVGCDADWQSASSTALSQTSDVAIDANPIEMEFVGTDDELQHETDQQTRAILRQLGDFNRMLLGR
ncbi:MAG: hypothetical protein NXI04_08795 [Planctomycetaceae bacterium]|nr:hypothetical protein [Planctomycetaceae bacterium]